jgi:hypothetical protein
VWLDTLDQNAPVSQFDGGVFAKVTRIVKAAPVARSAPPAAAPSSSAAASSNGASPSNAAATPSPVRVVPKPVKPTPAPVAVSDEGLLNFSDDATEEDQSIPNKSSTPPLAPPPQQQKPQPTPQKQPEPNFFESGDSLLDIVDSTPVVDQYSKVSECGRTTFSCVCAFYLLHFSVPLFYLGEAGERFLRICYGFESCHWGFEKLSPGF